MSSQESADTNVVVAAETVTAPNSGASAATSEGTEGGGQPYVEDLRLNRRLYLNADLA